VLLCNIPRVADPYPSLLSFWACQVAPKVPNTPIEAAAHAASVAKTIEHSQSVRALDSSPSCIVHTVRRKLCPLLPRASRKGQPVWFPGPPFCWEGNA
jgi:hypothetical protein